MEHNKVFSFDLFLEARAEILTKILLVFWWIWLRQKDILKLTDLYEDLFLFIFFEEIKDTKNRFKII